MRVIFTEMPSDQKGYFCDFKPPNPTTKLRLSSIFLTLILFIFFACTKEMSKESSNAPVPKAGDFYATIGGNLWNADSLQLVLVSFNSP